MTQYRYVAQWAIGPGCWNDETGQAFGDLASAAQDLRDRVPGLRDMNLPLEGWQRGYIVSRSPPLAFRIKRVEFQKITNRALDRLPRVAVRQSELRKRSAS